MSGLYADRIAQLESAIRNHETALAGCLRRERRTRRLSLALAVLIAVAMAPLAVRAGFQPFNDVPPSHTFFESINDAYLSGIATGCGNGNYCPNAAVTRGQMAAFLHRGAGAIGSGTALGSINETGVETILGNIQIRPGDIGGFAVPVAVDATLNVFTDQSGCPCEIKVWLENHHSGIRASQFHFVDIVGINAGDGEVDAQVTIITVEALPTGEYTTLDLVAVRTVGTADFSAYGPIRSVYDPFSSCGTDCGIGGEPPRLDDPS